jgi:hypothetical protein
MLRRRTLPHSSSSASNYIACSYRDSYTLDCTAFASIRFSHVHMRICSAAEKYWPSSCFTGRTNIPRHGSDASTVRHCTSKEQYDSRVNGNKYTLVANAKLEIRHIYLEYTRYILDIYQTYLDHLEVWQRSADRDFRRRDPIY